MIKIDVQDAESRLGQLIEEAASGQEVVISGAEGRAVRLVLVAPESESDGPATANRVGHSLDRFIGTWSAEQEAEVLEAVAGF